MGSVISGIGNGIGNLASGITGMVYHQNPSGPYVDPGQTPTYGGYQSIRDPNTGLLMNPGMNVQLDTSGVNALKQRALAAPGTSDWEKLAGQKQQVANQQLTQQQEMNQQKAAQSGLEQGASRAADARNQIAMRGGLSSGASERNARNSMRDILAGQQGVTAQGAQQKQDIGFQNAQANADIGLNAENQRLSALGQLPQAQLAALAPQEFNIKNALEQKQAEEAAKLQQYHDQMAAYGAGQTANAIAGSGPKSGGLLGGLFG